MAKLSNSLDLNLKCYDLNIKFKKKSTLKVLLFIIFNRSSFLLPFYYLSILNTLYLSLGSNLGHREMNLKEAIRRLIQDENIHLIQQSSVIETRPWGVSDSHPNYLNQVIKIETNYYPFKMLRVTQDIEKQMGRLHKGELQPREIDIDIIFFNRLVLDSDSLILPHPRYRERLFVLKPLLEITPLLTDPQMGIPVETFLKQMEEP